jgi:hypothetical protein
MTWEEVFLVQCLYAATVRHETSSTLCMQSVSFSFGKAALNGSVMKIYCSLSRNCTKKAYRGSVGSDVGRNRAPKQNPNTAISKLRVAGRDKNAMILKYPPQKEKEIG